jgi:hypothetical protein
MVPYSVVVQWQPDDTCDFIYGLRLRYYHSPHKAHITCEAAVDQCRGS